MLVLADLGGEATGLAGRLHARLEALGVYRPESRPWLAARHACSASASGRGSTPRCRRREHSFRPMRLLYLSRLHPTGARYEVLERVSLTAGG